MDIHNVFSSSEDQRHHSYHSNTSDGKETVHTQSNRLKTKTIKKNYQPITNQKGKIIRFQEDPSQYKRLRKKVQNRESAARVRGRKKDEYQNMGEELELLRKKNLDLQLQNARLETENKNLKGQLQYVKTLVRPSKLNDPVECYLSDDVLEHPPSSRSPPSSTMQEEEDSMMLEELNFFRTESNSSGIGWPSIAIFTIILAVFVLPSSSGALQHMKGAAFQNQQQVQVIQMSFMTSMQYYGKIVVKYALVVGYILLLFSKIQSYLKGRKIKRI